jgi:hypothetical protein
MLPSFLHFFFCRRNVVLFNVKANSTYRYQFSMLRPTSGFLLGLLFDIFLPKRRAASDLHGFATKKTILYSPCWAWSLFNLLIYSRSVRLPRRVISSSQGFYLNTGQHKHRKHIYTPNIHALSGIWSHGHSVRASEDSSCLRPLYRDRNEEYNEDFVMCSVCIVHF